MPREPVAFIFVEIPPRPGVLNHQEEFVDLPQTIQVLRSEKRWYDEVIASVEAFRRSKPFRATLLLGLYMEQKAKGVSSPLSPRRRLRLTRWLRRSHVGPLTGRPPSRYRPYHGNRLTKW